MRIGWIGTGIMGASMCAHLMDAGHDVTVYNRTKEKASALLQKGAQWAASPALAAEGADAVFSIVGYPSDVESVYFGEDGILSRLSPGSVAIDMTTSSPELAKQIAEAAQARGAWALDAPVSGGDVGAQEARLAIMVGGDTNAYSAVIPLFEIMGKTISLMGPAGSGQHTKMANQIAIAGTMIGTVESLLYGRRAGLELDALIDVIGSGAAGSWSLNNLGRRIAKNDMEPGFMIMHYMKDMGIALEESRKMGISLPGLSLVESFYRAAVGRGMERNGTQALFQVLDELNAQRT
ncbi:MAG: NAD(P)-dependent oxidoreductase [Spirochaetales bacterium]|nr:NAD(P)-dependent oxidoreductase [Spirochaetales bacterium]